MRKRPIRTSVLALMWMLCALPVVRSVAQDGLQAPAPPSQLIARDRPWDKGEKIDLRWKLSPDDSGTIASYRIYRSLTTKPAEQDALERRIEDLWYLFEDLYVPMFGFPPGWPEDEKARYEFHDPTPEEREAAGTRLRSELESLLPEIKILAKSQHADDYDYERYAEAAIEALETYLAAGMGLVEANRRAAAAVKLLNHEIPLSELQKAKIDYENAAERVARDAVTESKLAGLFGDNWKEESEERADEIPVELRKSLLDTRLEAELQAETKARREIATRVGETRWKLVAEVEPKLLNIRRGEMSYTAEQLDRHQEYLFKVVAVNRAEIESAPAIAASPVSPDRQIYDGNRLAMMLVTLIVCGAVVLFIGIARTGRPLKVRKIAGLSAVEEAVGRATEMGRSILFVCGIQDMNDIQTIAGITVLSRVAKTAAEYDAKIEVPTARSLVMTAARETVQASYLAAGRPDAYNEDLIYYVTDEQFGFVAYLQGMMSREKPAACFYMGTFFAESLILAETGNSIGAIQIAGTAMPAQLPFFVAACDYTLIGEEFFAASAYLSGEPDQLGSLKGQDVGKAVVGIIVVLGVFLATALSVAALAGNEVLAAHLEEIVEYLQRVILT
ncbi:MAG: hypothetical protein JSV91_06735 [Phycisphaerales bacterium]|nr:MAG: hypothetical protein JSV91_06735 [Phycisphaerales bacterium]